jgi:putative heme iron utilization protein
MIRIADKIFDRDMNSKILSGFHRPSYWGISMKHHMSDHTKFWRHMFVTKTLLVPFRFPIK